MAEIQTVTNEYYGVCTTVNVIVDKLWQFIDVPADAWFYDNIYGTWELKVLKSNPIFWEVMKYIQYAPSMIFASSSRRCFCGF